MFRVLKDPIVLTTKIKNINRYFQYNYHSNQYFRPSEWILDQEIQYDTHIEFYQKTWYYFLTKRKMTKEEIPPKIYIIPTSKEIKNLLSSQKLLPFKKLLKIEELKEFKTKESINSRYIASVALEPHFKNLMDEYLNKIIMNGAMPPLNNYKNYSEIKRKVISLYKTFFFGEILSKLECHIENIYLGVKFIKWQAYVEKQRVHNKCIWTVGNSRASQNLSNIFPQNESLYEIFRPIQKSNLVDELYGLTLLNLELSGLSWLKRNYLKFKAWRVQKRGKLRASFTSYFLLMKSVNYTECPEFLEAISIPEDFQIKYGILNLHVWLIMNRLKDINTEEAKFMAYDLDKKFHFLLNQNSSKLHLRKRNDFVRDLTYFIKTSRNNFYYHFCINPKTKDNHSYKSDALAYSSIFMQKVPRYADEVFLLADYMVENFKYVNQLSFSQLENGEFEWDIFKSRINCKEEILKLNPALSPEELEKEKENPNRIKKYHYFYDESEQKS